jgi:hypothetical protein
MGRRETARILTGKPEGKRLFGRSWNRWEDNTEMGLREIGWDGVAGSIWLSTWTVGGLLCMR